MCPDAASGPTISILLQMVVIKKLCGAANHKNALLCEAAQQKCMRPSPTASMSNANHAVTWRAADLQ